MEKLEYEVGDIVRLKKQHPCGSSEWEILRVGADFRLKCTGCGHQIMIARKLVEKNTKDDARTATVEKAKDYIVRAGGTVTEVEDWGKKKLAYDIQKMSEGYYYFIQFEAEATVPAAVEQDVRIMDNVLRFLCVRKDEA